MALDHGINCLFTLGIQSRDVLSGRIDLFVEGVGFCLSLSMLRGSTFTFTRQPFCLNSKTLQRSFDLSGNLAQSLGNGGMLQQIRSRILNFSFGLRGQGKLFGIRLFCRPQAGRALIGFASQSDVVFLQPLTFGLNKDQPLG